MKKLLSILSVFICLSSFSQVHIGGPGDVVPDGNYPAMRLGNYQSGSYPVQTLAQRNAIVNRVAGMTSYVIDSAKTYRLGTDTTTWIEVISGISNAQLKKGLDSLNSPIYFHTTQVTKSAGLPTTNTILDSSLTVTGVIGAKTLTVTSGTPSIYVGSFPAVVYDGSRYVSYSVLNVIGNTVTLLEPLKNYITNGTLKTMHDIPGGYHLSDYGYRAMADAFYEQLKRETSFSNSDKLVIYMDSWGVKTDAEGFSFQKRIQARLVADGGSSANVINNSKSGQTSAWANYWFDSLVVKSGANYAAVGFAINDARSIDSTTTGFDFDPTSPLPSGTTDGNTTPKKWYDNYQSMISKAKAASIKMIVIMPPNVDNVTIEELLQRDYTPKMESVVTKDIRLKDIGGSTNTNPAIGIQNDVYIGNLAGKNLGAQALGTLHVQGSSNANTDFSLVVRNAGNANSFIVTNNGQVGVGQAPSTGNRFAIGASSSLTNAFYIVRSGGGGEYQISSNLQTSLYSTMAQTSGSNFFHSFSSLAGFTPASGSGRFGVININTPLNASGSYGGIMGGIYYNPTLTSLTGVDHRAWENTSGNMIFNSLSGKIGTQGIFTPTSGLHLGIGNPTAGSAPIKFTSPVLTTSTASGNGTTATLTYPSQAFTFPIGATITITGATPSGYNGTYIVTASAVNSVSYANTTTGAQTVAGTITTGLLTTPEAGAVEYDGTDFYATPNNATRYVLMKGLEGSATLDFPSTAAQTSSELTFTLTGVSVGDNVLITRQDGTAVDNAIVNARGSAANTVTAKFNNYSSSTIDPASSVFTVRVIK